MQSANLSGPFRGCLYYALLGLPQATGLAGGYDLSDSGCFLVKFAGAIHSSSSFSTPWISKTSKTSCPRTVRAMLP